MNKGYDAAFLIDNVMNKDYDAAFLTDNAMNKGYDAAFLIDNAMNKGYDAAFLTDNAMNKDYDAAFLKDGTMNNKTSGWPPSCRNKIPWLFHWLFPDQIQFFTDQNTAVLQRILSSRSR